MHTDADVIFTKAKAAGKRKGARKINFDEFCHALEMIAEQKQADVTGIIGIISNTKPASSGTKTTGQKVSSNRPTNTHTTGQKVASNRPTNTHTTGQKVASNRPTNTDTYVALPISTILHRAPFFQNGAKSGFEMCFGPSTMGAGAKTRLESRIKKFTPHCVCRYRGTHTEKQETSPEASSEQQETSPEAPSEQQETSPEASSEQQETSPEASSEKQATSPEASSEQQETSPEASSGQESPLPVLKIVPDSAPDPEQSIHVQYDNVAVGDGAGAVTAGSVTQQLAPPTVDGTHQKRAATSSVAGARSPSMSAKRNTVKSPAPVHAAVPINEAFEYFACFGANRAAKKIELDNAHFIKMLKETGIINKKFTSTNADIIFARVKKTSGRKHVGRNKTITSRKLDFDEFMMALEVVAVEKGMTMGVMEDKICKSGGPKTNR